MKNTKFIINNQSNLDYPQLFERIQSLMSMGKISMYNGTYGYCCAKGFDDSFISTSLSRCGTHVFTVTDK
jgi:hypothetical protein